MRAAHRRACSRTGAGHRAAWFVESLEGLLCNEVRTLVFARDVCPETHNIELPLFPWHHGHVLWRCPCLAPMDAPALPLRVRGAKGHATFKFRSPVPGSLAIGNWQAAPQAC